jgi:hypothetical protein
MMLVLKGPEVALELGSKFHISQDAQYCPEQNFSCLLLTFHMYLRKRTELSM